MKYDKFGSGGCSKKVLLCVVVCVGVAMILVRIPTRN